MKKTAALVLCIVLLIQSGSVVSTMFTDATSVYVVDENTEIKYKKENILLTVKSLVLPTGSNKAMHVMEKIQAAPCLEKLIPPPDFI